MAQHLYDRCQGIAGWLLLEARTKSLHELKDVLRNIPHRVKKHADIVLSPFTAILQLPRKSWDIDAFTQALEPFREIIKTPITAYDFEISDFFEPSFEPSCKWPKQLECRTHVVDYFLSVILNKNVIATATNIWSLLCHELVELRLANGPRTLLGLMVMFLVLTQASVGWGIGGAMMVGLYEDVAFTAKCIVDPNFDSRVPFLTSHPMRDHSALREWAIKVIIIHLKFRPGGPGAVQAQERFET